MNEIDKYLEVHYKRQAKELMELFKKYQEAKEAEYNEIDSNKKYLFNTIKRDLAVDIVDTILREKDMMERLNQIKRNYEK